MGAYKRIGWVLGGLALISVQYVRWSRFPGMGKAQTLALTTALLGVGVGWLVARVRGKTFGSDHVVIGALIGGGAFFVALITLAVVTLQLDLAGASFMPYITATVLNALGLTGIATGLALVAETPTALPGPVSTVTNAEDG